MNKENQKKNGQAPDAENEFNLNADENIRGDQRLDDGMLDESEFEKLQQELEGAEKKNSELEDKYVRLAADFDNFRKRNARERVELIQTAGRDVITDLLEVLDDAERAEKQLEHEENESVKEGVMLVFSKLRNLLAAKGLKPMEAMNQEFNPDLHEAITEIDGGEDMRGKVVAEIQKGYYLNDKIIRFAKVVVGK
ncbi:MAG: nucleotide exchange factor GrpE [Flavisolibacter sp.]